MCFTPAASLATASIEFIIVIYLFYRITDKRLYPLPFFVLLLGVYQFTEFLLCTTTTPEIWARIGFAAYTFMPILLYHFFINASGNTIKKVFYSIPIFFSVLALFYPNFIQYTSCNKLHVTVESLVFNQNTVLMLLYLLYYLYFPVYSVYVFSKKMGYTEHITLRTKIGVAAAPMALLTGLIYYLWSSIIEKDQTQTWMHTSTLIVVSTLILILLSSFLLKKSKTLFYKVNSFVLATTGITIILLYYLIPNITLNYSSIFCQFALLYGIASVILTEALDGKVPSDKWLTKNK